MVYYFRFVLRRNKDRLMAWAWRTAALRDECQRPFFAPPLGSTAQYFLPIFLTFTGTAFPF